MAKLSAEGWKELRAASEAGESDLSLSKRFGPDRKTIRARRLKENWAIPQSIPHMGKTELEAVRNETRSKVISIGTELALAAASGAIEQIAESVAEDLLAHNEVAAGMMAASKTLVERFVKEALTGDLGDVREQDGKEVITRQGLISQFASLTNGIKNAVTVSREKSGIGKGQPSVPDTSTQKQRKFTFEVAPRPTEAQTA